MYRIDFHLSLQMKFYLSVRSDNCKKANLDFHVFLKHRSCHYHLNYDSYNKTILLPQFHVTSSILSIRHQCLTNGSILLRAGWRKQGTGRAKTFVWTRQRTLVSSPGGSWWVWILSVGPALFPLILQLLPSSQASQIPAKWDVFPFPIQQMKFKWMPDSKAAPPLLSHRVVLIMEKVIYVRLLTQCHIGVSCCHCHHYCHCYCCHYSVALLN